MNDIRFFANKNYDEIDDPLDVGHRPPVTDLFEVQMSLIDIGNGQAAWGGSLHNVNNGEKRFFKDWSGLVANLQEILTPLAQFRVLQELMAAEIALEYMQNTRWEHLSYEDFHS